MQAGHLFKGNGGFQNQLSLSNHAKMNMMPVRSGGMSMPGNGKVVNMPMHDKGSDHNFGGNHDLGMKPQKQFDAKPQKQFDAKPQKSFTQRQFSNTNHFTNSQARMGSMRMGGGGGMRMMGGMGGGHFGGGFGGGGFGHH